MAHDPIYKKVSKDEGGIRTICHCHREIYELLQGEMSEEDRKRAVEILEEAFDKGVKMSRKLHEYTGKSWKPDVYNQTK